MDKNQAIALINKNNKKDGQVLLTGRNTHWANLGVYGGKHGWWLNIPFSKFKENLFLILNNKQSKQMFFIHISSSAISEPHAKFRHKKNLADIFISAVNTNNLSNTDVLIDNQSNGTKHDFSFHCVKVLQYKN